MKSKEEIWKKHMEAEKLDNSNIEFRYDQTIYDAMEEYAGVLREALEKIINMKEPGNNYAFNRCWHIATEALSKSTASEDKTTID